jgi:hypothetical protein
MSAPTAVVLSAPQGWGKTRHASALMAEHRCHTVVDGWTPRIEPIKPGALHLTNVHPGEIPAMPGVRVVSRGWKGGAA